MGECPIDREIKEPSSWNSKAAGAFHPCRNNVKIEGSWLALAILEEPVGVFEVGLSFADRLDLCAAQRDACLKAISKEVVEARRTVEGGIPVTGSHRIAVLLLDYRLGRVGYGRIGKIARHDDLSS